MWRRIWNVLESRGSFGGRRSYFLFTVRPNSYREDVARTSGRYMARTWREQSIQKSQKPVRHFRVAQLSWRLLQTMMMPWLSYNSLILKNREEFGCPLCGWKRERKYGRFDVMTELNMYPDRFQNFYRMSHQCFYTVLHKLKDSLKKKLQIWDSLFVQKRGFCCWYTHLVWLVTYLHRRTDCGL
jgi:hypothetical protein